MFSILVFPLNNLYARTQLLVGFLGLFINSICIFSPTFQPGNKADTSKTAAQVVKGERNQIEDKLNQEQLQSLRLRQELANVERRNTELTEASYITLTKLRRVSIWQYCFLAVLLLSDALLTC